MAGPLEYVPATPTPEHGPTPVGRVPAPLREAPPGFRPAHGALVNARVLGVDRNGHLMLRTDSGVMTLASALRPPTGSEVVLHFRVIGGAIQAYILRTRPPDHARGESGTDPISPDDPDDADAALAGPGTLTRLWPALDSALARLAAGAGGESGTPGLADRLPQPGPGLLSALLFALKALTARDLRGWLGGDALSVLHRLNDGRLAEHLTADFEQLAALTGPDREGWQLFALPLVHGARVRMLRLYLHRPPEETEGPGPQRFVVELDLPRLGPLQLDGLLTEARLEMILRSREALPEALRARLVEIAAAGRDLLRREGSLSFVAGSGWSPRPVPETAAPSAGVVV